MVVSTTLSQSHIFPTCNAKLRVILRISIKVAFLEGRLLSSLSEQSEKFSKSLDWLEKSLPSKKAAFV